MKSFIQYLNESNYKLSFRASGAKTSSVMSTGTKDEMLALFKTKYPSYTVHDDFGSKFAGGDGLYAAKTSGKGAGEVSITKV